nr:MAG TPA: hypothetical protein [Caudoviricetes sp.]
MVTKSNQGNQKKFRWLQGWLQAKTSNFNMYNIYVTIVTIFY